MTEQDSTLNEKVTGYFTYSVPDMAMYFAHSLKDRKVFFEKVSYYYSYPWQNQGFCAREKKYINLIRCF